MKINEIRRLRLRQVIDSAPFNGSAAEFSRAVGKPERQINDMLSTPPRKSFGEKVASAMCEKLGKSTDYFDKLLPSSDITKGGIGAEFDVNVTAAALGMRAIPVISNIQAGLMTEISDPYSPGDGFATEICDDDLGPYAFALEIEGDSMLPDFRPGDRIIIDPDVTPNPGDFVVAKNGRQEATFKKFRPRGSGIGGSQTFELVPLNNDYPTLNSEIDHLRIIGTMVEHRKKFRRR